VAPLLPSASLAHIGDDNAQVIAGQNPQLAKHINSENLGQFGF
jgi:hypothetical protein